MMQTKKKPRVLSGIQPSGRLHLGNYLGAVRNWVNDQEQFENYFMIADYHAITTLPDPEILRQNKRELIGMLLACGIDPQKSVLFVQSDVPAHVELSWIFTCATPLGWLERMTQYKDKVQKQKEGEGVGSGLLLYPTLMAADILLYQADYVPVGDDQRQHVELTRDIAQRMNSYYREIFNIPAPLIRDTGARIMSLSDPLKKMSKSEGDESGCIGLLDPIDQVKNRILRAVTDSKREIVFDPSPDRAGVYNLLTIYQALTGKTKIEIEEHFKDSGYSLLKSDVADCVINELESIQSKYNQIMSDPTYIDNVLKDGAESANNIASKTLDATRKAIGIS